jgi:alkanesulfonate monooxygenase SsuD/methylene tetrahydromethanopterin reductase-like flavin-dependent oxidoreductase (luciferase family)
MKAALSLPPFGQLADPGLLVEIALAAEEADIDGCFLWDHVYRPETDPREILDPWVILGAQALATDRIRLGPMVTPLTRRRPIKLAREALTVDHLSAGRLTLGLGLGVDSGGELSRFGEIVDAKQRGDRLDEGVGLLQAFWSGEPVTHTGPAFRADDVTVLPQPVQQPRIPLWFAARGASAKRPIRRAARFDGLVPIELENADHLSRMLDVVLEERGSLDGFDTMVGSQLDPVQAERRGATWSYQSFDTHATGNDVFAVIDRGRWVD